MIEIKDKSITLRTMNRKEMRALWRKFEPEEGYEKNYVYDEQKVDQMYDRSVEREEWNPSVGIFLRNDEIIGELTFVRIVYSEKRCDICLFLASETYRNKGYGTAAVNLAKAYAKDKMELKRIYADVSSDNLRMQKVLKKCGFLHTKTYKGNMPDGSDRLSYVAVL